MKSAILIAGGKGERLRPLTKDKPKAMISVMGRPIISYLLQWLEAYDIRNIIISCGYLHEVIQEYFGNGNRFNLNIQYVIEENPLGRGGGIKQAMKQLDNSNDPILALNADAITNLNLTEFHNFHKHNQGMATLVSVPLISSYGIVDIEKDNNVISFREKPELPFWINAGIYIFEREIFNLLPDIGDHETTTFPELTSKKLLKAFKTTSFWRSVDTVKDLEELRKELEGLFFGSFFKM